MKKLLLISLVFLLALITTSCRSKSSEIQSNRNLNKIVEIKEVYLTERDTVDNVDSPAIWHGPKDEHWLLATAKETNVILVFEASSGKLIKKIGGTGNEPGKFLRPNGIFVIEDLMVVVERGNKRIQVLSLPDFRFLGFIGKGLIKPYGLYIYKKTDDLFSLFVTDNYEKTEDVLPPDNELNRRVHIYNFKIENNKVASEFVKAFGDTTGDGVLRVVESIYGDPQNHNLLIAEEDESDTFVKVYDLNGMFKGKLVGKNLFKYQVEGITLFECQNNSGVWIITDQSHTENIFHIFDRITYAHIGSFKGQITKNTDGIWLTKNSFPGFNEGAFFAVHDDGNIAAFNWGDVVDSLNFTTFCTN